MIAQAYKMTYYEFIEHGAASTRTAWFWSYEEGFTACIVLTHQVKTKCWFDDIDA